MRTPPPITTSLSAVIAALVLCIVAPVAHAYGAACTKEKKSSVEPLESVTYDISTSKATMLYGEPVKHLDGVVTHTFLSGVGPAANLFFKWPRPAPSTAADEADHFEEEYVIHLGSASRGLVMHASYEVKKDGSRYLKEASSWNAYCFKVD